MHPELKDEDLVKTSRFLTVMLAIASLAVALTVAVVQEDRTVFWFVIFGWSGIAATFCPTIILSLFWRGFTAKGALVGMISGFLCVPFFKFVAPSLPGIGALVDASGELPPAFFVSGICAILVSTFDRTGQIAIQDIDDDFAEFDRDES